MEVGLRVVRGKDWKWGDQDGGEGSVGTVADVGCPGGKIPQNTVVVVWDTGAKANYRAGHQGADDLKVFDNAAAGTRHPNISCDICNESGLLGTLWHCEVCLGYDLCHACYMGDKHELSHAFTRWDTAMSLGVPVSARSGSRKVQAKGIYLGAKVVRGTNWNYKNQDGGPDKQGVVQSISGSSEGVTWRSWVKVKWDSGGANDYRRGHDGKVDVKCVKVAAGETYYVDHLACLADYADSVFCSGDRVKLDESQMLDAHKDQISEFLGKLGTVITDTDEQKLYVQFPGEDNAYCLPSNYLTKVKTFRKGDTVLISNDMQTVIRFQSGHGEWNDEMDSCLGMEAEVRGTDSDGDVRVVINGRKWTFNPEVCTLLIRGSGDKDDNDSDSDSDKGDDADSSNDEDETSDTGDDNFDLDALLASLLEEAAARSVTADSLVMLAAEGDLDAVRSIIKYHPSQVNIKYEGFTALQAAAYKGHLEIVVALAEAGASVDMQDKAGDNALHFAAIGGQTEVLEALVIYKPDLVNNRNNMNMTCLHQAAIKQFPECLEVLLKYNADVNLQDKDGNTALHVAVGMSDTEIQSQLINHPKADFNLMNRKGNNVIHSATLENNINALNKLLLKAPTLVNVANSDGIAALHIAVINSYRDAAEVLIHTGKANMNATVRGLYTPLQMAVHKSRYSMIEFLVSRGADLNAQDRDGDTALHFAAKSLRQKTSFSILNVFRPAKKPKCFDDTPAISKIFLELPSSAQKQGEWIAICCYLLQNGAQMDIQNDSGESPGNFIGDSKIKQILKKYSGTSGQVRQAKTPIAQSFRQATASSASFSPKCMMCLTTDSDMTFYPCGHKVTCSDCSGRMKTCFSCHEKIQKKVQSSASDPADPTIRRGQNTTSNNTSSPANLRRSRMATDSVNCPICETRVRNVVFPCGHSCCKECSEPLTSCHVCAQFISRKLTLM